MKVLALAAILLSQAQERPPVRLTVGAPDEKGWPITGTIDKPDETIVQIGAVRIERRWDSRAKRFNEHLDGATRILRSAEVMGKRFEVRLPVPAGTQGLYKLTVAEKGKAELYSERIVRGRGADVFKANGKQVKPLLEVCDRFGEYVNLLDAVAKDKKLSTKQRHAEFVKRIQGDEELLKKSTEQADLPATIALMRELVSLILSAQVWPRPEDAAAQNDGDLIFSDPQMTFDTLRTFIAAIKSVLAVELRASAATILEEMFRRAQERPALLTGTGGAKSAAGEALKSFKDAPEGDKGFDELLENAEKADEKTLGDVVQGLQSAVQSLVPRS